MGSNDVSRTSFDLRTISIYVVIALIVGAGAGYMAGNLPVSSLTEKKDQLEARYDSLSLAIQSLEVELDSTPENRKDLDGLKVRKPGENSVYLIDKGRRRNIPSPTVYNRLFTTWDNIHLDLDINDIEEGPPIPETAIMFRCFDSPKVFLLDGEYPNQVKRWIRSRQVMTRFEFRWENVQDWNVRLSVVGIDDGDAITKTGRPD